MSTVVGLETGTRRRVTPWTQLHDWVRLSGVSDTACSLYWVMKMHVFVSSGETEIRTSTEELAALCGLSRGDKLTRYVRELEAIGAVTSRFEGMPRRKIYGVEDEPPDDYTGPRSLKEWYEIRRAVKALKSSAEQAAKPQVSPVAPETGEQGEASGEDSAKPQVSPVAPETGEQDQLPPNGGPSVAPKRGDSKRRSSSSRSTSSTSTPEPVQDSPGSGGLKEQKEEQKPKLDEDQNHAGNDLTAEEKALFDECLAMRPDWVPSRLRLALTHPDVRDRSDRDLVRRAFLLGAKNRKTQAGRMDSHGCPHWAEALEQRAEEQRNARLAAQQEKIEQPEVSGSAPAPRSPIREETRRGANPDHPELVRLREQWARDQVGAAS